MDGVDGTGLVAPVCHDYAVEAPFITQEACEQVMALLGI